MYKSLMLCLAAAVLASPVFAESDKPEKNIAETAVSAGQFNTLVAAAKAAGLVEALTDKGPLTVFAPTDAAFAKLPKITLEEWLLPENKGKLADVLKYHIVAGEYPAEKVLGKEALETLQGKPIQIRREDSVVMINNAKVVKTDIKCSNGIIHVIDAVMLPPDAGTE